MPGLVTAPPEGDFKKLSSTLSDRLLASASAMDLHLTLTFVILGGAVALFLSLALYHYRLPGLYYDEAADVVPAITAERIAGKTTNASPLVCAAPK